MGVVTMEIHADHQSLAKRGDAKTKRSHTSQTPRKSLYTFELSLSNRIGIELRETSPRQVFPIQDKTRHLAHTASVGACRRPTLGQSH